MTWNQHKPCEACPYRRDTPVGIWSDAEYADLARADSDPMRGNTYGCHLNSVRSKDDAQPCAGWLADQKRRGTPSIALRAKLMMSSERAALYERIDENDPGLYGSIVEMMKANLGKPFPNNSPKARRLLEKLGNKRKDK